jgi:hypothetical protein
MATGWASRAGENVEPPSWPDALAVVSLIAPVLMLVFAALDFAVAVQEVVDNSIVTRFPVWHPLSFVPFLGLPAAVMTGWLAVVLLGLAGRRRAAAAIASIPLALSLLNALASVMALSGAWAEGVTLFLAGTGLATTVVMASLAVCSLAFSVGPRRGLAIAGRLRACLMIAGLSAGFAFAVIVDLDRPPSWAAETVSLLAGLAIAVAVAVTSAGSAVDRRVAVLVATGLLLYLADNEAAVPLSVVPLLITSLVSLLVAVLVWLVAIPSSGRPDRRASRAGQQADRLES